MLWEPMTWNLGLGMWPKPRIFYCHRSRQPMVHCVLDWNFIYVTKTLGYMGGSDKVAQGSRHGGMGP